jgi:glycosyltransferase involved in cell wall biosynthesis
MGALPNIAAIEWLRHADILLLPSTGKEGWGAVINEALMQGVPVLCSDRCGARDLLAEPWIGEVFKTDSVKSLGDVLARWIVRGKRTPELTKRIQAWSRCIEGDSVADYFASVLRHVYGGAQRPVPQWSWNGFCT